MKFISYTIHPSGHDPAPGRGTRPALADITINPGRCMDRNELLRLISDLKSIADQMREESHEDTRDSL